VQCIVRSRRYAAKKMRRFITDVAWSVFACLSVRTTVSCAKTAEPIEMPVDSGGSEETCFEWGQVPPPRKTAI